MRDYAFNIAGIILLVFVVTVAAVSPIKELRSDEVKLSDAKSFKETAETVRNKYWIALNHATDERRQVIWQNNGPEVSELWEEDCKFRFKAWDLLDDAIHCTHYADGKRIDSLRRLREMIGDDDYYAGRMPAPVPAYRK